MAPRFRRFNHDLGAALLFRLTQTKTPYHPIPSHRIPNSEPVSKTPVSLAYVLFVPAACLRIPCMRVSYCASHVLAAHPAHAAFVLVGAEDLAVLRDDPETY